MRVPGRGDTSRKKPLETVLRHVSPLPGLDIFIFTYPAFRFAAYGAQIRPHCRGEESAIFFHSHRLDFLIFSFKSLNASNLFMFSSIARWR